MTGPFMNLSTYYDDQAVLQLPGRRPSARADRDDRRAGSSSTTPCPRACPSSTARSRRRASRSLVFYIYLRFGLALTVETLDKLKELGFVQATQAGFSLGIDDFVIPKEQGRARRQGQKEVQEIEKLYLDGTISARERFNNDRQHLVGRDGRGLGRP